MESTFDEGVAIAENLVLHEKATGARYAVVVRGWSGELPTALERIDIPDQWPILIRREKLAEAIKAKEYVIDYSYSESRTSYLPPSAGPEPKERKASKSQRLITPHVTPGKAVADDRRWKLLKDVLETPEYPQIVYGINRTKNLEALASRFKVSRPHLRTVLMLYWRNGLSKAATQTDLDKCGNKGQCRNSKNNERLGGPRKFAADEGLGALANEQTRKHLQIAADYYFGSKNATYQKAIDYITALYCTTITKAENGIIRTIELRKKFRPTVRQLRHFIYKNYPNGTRKRTRATPKEWDLLFRGLEGRATDIAHGPGERFQIDATIADVYIVSRLDRRFVIARPTIYFVIDTWSRLIVGMYVGLEPPSWAAAMMALINCVENKVEYCARYGISIEQWQWPAAHLPACLLGDKGELLSIRLARDVVDVLGVRIDNAPGGRPDLKAIIERRFGIYPSSFGPWMPGHVERDWVKKGLPDGRETAAYDLEQFTTAVILAVIDHNTNRVIMDFDAPPKMVGDGIPPIPYLLWQWGIANLGGVLTKRPVEEVRMCVYPEVNVAVTEHGIKYEHVFYNSPTCHAQGWKARARNKGVWHILGRANPNRLGDLYIPIGGRKFEKCVLAEPVLDDITWCEREDLYLRGRENEEVGHAQGQAGRVDEILAQQTVQDDATAQTEAVLYASDLRHPIKKHIKRATKAERELRKKFGAPSAPKPKLEAQPLNDTSLTDASRQQKAEAIQRQIDARNTQHNYDKS